jgi:hypothetical protein
MKEEPNIDELLNGFIDGELDQRHQTEVQRLIAHNAQIAERLRELQKCKVLVSSLPCVEAPAEMAGQIKASLETSALLGRQPEPFDAREGARHLLVRRVLAAAAMIGLVAVLAAVVYTIVAPESVTDRPIAVESWQRPGIVATAEKSIAQISPAVTGFNGRLELKTSDLVAVNAFINGAIEDNDLLGKVSPEAEGDKSVYTLSCSRSALSLLLADLENVWARFDSATLFVETDRLGGQVVVDNVSAEQIVDLITPPKPRLTGDEKTSEKTIKKPESQAEDEEKVNLTIVVVGR